MVGAVVVVSATTFFLPDSLRLAPAWVLPLVEAALVVTLLVGDPGRIDNKSRWLRVVALALVAILTFSAIWSTVRLIDDLTQGSEATNSASALLQSGSAVWTSTIVAFSLVYFELDGGGPAIRAHRGREFPDLAFPQHLSPELLRPGWRPFYWDYLYLAVTNSTAFSPTDVMPLARWAKGAMAVQSLTSLVIIGLVLARAVNVLT